MLLTRFSPANNILVLAGTAGAGGMAPSTSARISARLKCVPGHASPVNLVTRRPSNNDTSGKLDECGVCLGDNATCAGERNQVEPPPVISAVGLSRGQCQLQISPGIFSFPVLGF